MVAVKQVVKRATPRGAFINVRLKPETKAKMEALAQRRATTLSRAVEHLIESEVYMDELSSHDWDAAKPRATWLDRIRLKVGSFFG